MVRTEARNPDSWFSAPDYYLTSDSPDNPVVRK